MNAHILQRVQFLSQAILTINLRITPPSSSGRVLLHCLVTDTFQLLNNTIGPLGNGNIDVPHSLEGAATFPTRWSSDPRPLPPAHPRPLPSVALRPPLHNGNRSSGTFPEHLRRDHPLIPSPFSPRGAYPCPHRHLGPCAPFTCVRHLPSARFQLNPSPTSLFATLYLQFIGIYDSL